LICVLLAASSIHIWQRVRVMALVKEVDILKAENVSLTDDAIKYEAELSRLLSAERVIAYARDSLKMIAVPADRLFTLQREEEEQVTPDEIALMRKAIERITTHMPRLTRSEAAAGELRRTALDSLVRIGGER